MSYTLALEKYTTRLKQEHAVESLVEAVSWRLQCLKIGRVSMLKSAVGEKNPETGLVIWSNLLGYAGGRTSFDLRGLCKPKSALEIVVRKPGWEKTNHSPQIEQGTFLVGTLEGGGLRRLRMCRWFVCSPSFARFVGYLRNPETAPRSETALGSRLVSGTPADVLWAIVRRIHGNEAVFYSQEENPPQHPAQGRQYRPDEKKEETAIVNWRGMQLGEHPIAFLHRLNTLLEEYYPAAYSRSSQTSALVAAD